MPPISLAHPLSLIGAVFTPWIVLGIALLIGYFASYLTALSWADLTFVMPATALGNVFLALLAHFWLHESVSWMRWAGVVLITVGVGFVANGPVNTTPPLERTGLPLCGGMETDEEAASVCAGSRKGQA